MVGYPGKESSVKPERVGEPEGSRLKSYLLLGTLISRRSRRFAKGMSMNGGPLAYESQEEPEPLSLEEEAALAFAGCGVTGPTLAELPYEGGGEREAGSGNIIINFVGLDELARTREVLLHLWIRGFGVRLDEP
jgi:hypothetical protein